MGTKLATHLVMACAAAMCTAQLQAQIIIEYGDLAVPGDVIERYRDTLPSYGPGPAGEGQVWDMSMAQSHETITTTVSTAASTPFASAFATSNLAMTNDGSNYLYFRSQPTFMEATGFGGDPLGSGTPLSVGFAPALLLHQLPRAYGSNFTDDYYFQAIVDGSAFGVHSVRLRHRGDVRDSTDGHGALTTPAGTYQTLRVKSIEYSVDSIWFRLLSFTPWTLLSATQDTSVTYTWLAKETKLAVAEMTFDSTGAPARFIHSSLPPSITTAITAAHSDQELSLWPVPAAHEVVLRLGDAAVHSHLQVTAMDGRLVKERGIRGESQVRWEVGSWSAGPYVVRVHRLDGGPPQVLRMVVGH